MFVRLSCILNIFLGLHGIHMYLYRLQLLLAYYLDCTFMMLLYFELTSFGYEGNVCIDARCGIAWLALANGACTHIQRRLHLPKHVDPNVCTETGRK